MQMDEVDEPPEGQRVQVPHGFVLLPLKLEEVIVHE